MFGPTRSSPDRTAKIRAIKDWVREALGLSDDTIVMATELRCAEPGCPPLETVIAVMREGDDKQQFKVHKPLVEVVYEDLEDGAARMHRGKSHTHASSDREDGADEAPKTAR
jgi:hypothetical protein